MNARKRLIRSKQAGKQTKTGIPEGAETKNMFGFLHWFDESINKWVRVE
jgi:hypothetical protein